MELNIYVWVNIGVIIISFLVVLYGLYNKLNSERASIFLYIGLFIFILSVVFPYVGMLKMAFSSWEDSNRPYFTESIIALNDNYITSGRFYLRSGYINEDLYYQYLVKQSGGGYVTDKVKASNATLYYTDWNYRVEWYTRSKKWLYFEYKETFVKIYIPEGSISDNYSVDLK